MPKSLSTSPTPQQTHHSQRSTFTHTKKIYTYNTIASQLPMSATIHTIGKYILNNLRGLISSTVFKRRCANMKTPSKYARCLYAPPPSPPPHRTVPSLNAKSIHLKPGDMQRVFEMAKGERGNRVYQRRRRRRKTQRQKSRGRSCVTQEHVVTLSGILHMARQTDKQTCECLQRD